MLIIKNLSVSCEEKMILRDLSLEVNSGSIHAIMGPNGSGKSTFAQVVAGSPWHTVISGVITYQGNDLLSQSPESRAQLGIFVVFQQLPSIPGLSVITFLQESYRAIHKKAIDLSSFESEVREYLGCVGLDSAFLYRNLYDGFSGGEKKRFELLQILLIKPKLIIFDEIDSGLDIDGLKMISQVIQKLKDLNPSLVLIIITHYQRLLDYIRPDYVHLLSKGRFVTSGDYTLGLSIEKQGYQPYE